MTKKSTKLTQWFIWHGTFITLIISGVILGVGMAANVLKFLLWFTAIITFIGASKKKQKDNPSIPLHVTFFVDLGMACLLAAYGWFFYATLLMIACVYALSAYVSREDSKRVEGERWE